MRTAFWFGRTRAPGVGAGRPTPVSTFFLIFFGIGVVGSVAMYARDLAVPLDDRYYRVHFGLYSLGLALYVVGFALYYAYYRRCRPWTGWLVFLVGLIFMSVMTAQDRICHRRSALRGYDDDDGCD